MCKKETLVSRSSTEDVGWRLDGILVLDLSDLIVRFLDSRKTREVVSVKNQRSQGMSNVFHRIVVFAQTSSLRIKKHCCMCLRTTKQ